MSDKVKEWLLKLHIQTDHSERLEIDAEIERRTGENCDVAITKGMVSESVFREIVDSVKRKKQRKPLVAEMAA